MLSEIEKHLLLHYSEGECFISPRLRSHQHRRLVAFGYIREDVIDIGNLLVRVTPTGYAALNDGTGAA
jgi:hypothetical protein